jgi:leader peptidase (prepilin peptidase) / N-methyltransferase
VTSLAIGLAVAGAAWGLVADRIAARWPAHEDGSVRGVDWRTVVVIGVGCVSMAALPGRFAAPLPLAFFVAFVGALILLLATDLDQRLLPDVITLPLIPFAAIVAISGADPLVPPSELWFAAAAAVVLPAGLYVLSIPFGAGAIGMGDLKMMISVGLLAGFYRAFTGLLVGALLSGIVIVFLLVARRVSLRTYIPFGPFLIIGALVGILRT